MKIGPIEVGRGSPPLIIAEMSANHNGSLDRAIEIVEAAAACGAHALKIQTYTADTMTLNLDKGAFRIEDAESPWVGRTLYDLYNEAHTPWAWHTRIFERSRELGMVPFSTPFDETAVDFLESLGTACYKIASFENTDLPLIQRVAATGKPLIISTGMATAVEVGEAVEAARSAGCNDVILLKCTSTYPASPKDSNLSTMQDMRERFGCEVGLSDHTLGIGVALASVSLGAVAIEKHFTLRRSNGGVDSEFSMEPEEMALLVKEVGRAWQALGSTTYGGTSSEQASRIFRRSLYVVRDVMEGEEFSRDNVRAIRPGFGLAPKHIDDVIGRRAARLVLKGTPLVWDLLG